MLLPPITRRLPPEDALTPNGTLAWSPDGERIACGAEDGSVKVLAARDGDDLVAFTLEEGVSHVGWSSDGKRLAAATKGGEVHVWDATRGYEFSKHGSRRGELAWSHYESALNSEPELRYARLHEVRELAPDTRDYWELRGHASARLGDYERATTEFAKAIEPGLRRSFEAALYYADALLGNGDREAYSRHCAALLDAFRDTPVPSNGENVAWTCVLIPDIHVDLEAVLQLAQTSADVHGGNRQMRCLGAALYRSGRYEEAASLLTDLTTKLQSSADSSARGDLALSLNFLAMARHQLGHPFQARRYHDEAVKIAADILSGSSWTTKVQLDVINAEAKATIGD